MPAQGCTQGEGRLQAHRRAGLETTQSSEGQGLLGSIRVESLGPFRDDREATTAHGDAVAQAYALHGQTAGVDGDAQVTALGGERLGFTYSLDYSREHYLGLSIRRMSLPILRRSMISNSRRSCMPPRGGRVNMPRAVSPSTLGAM